MEKKKHILVVDDEQVITTLLERTLRDAGFDVTVANDGNSALAKLAEKEPDLILMDIKMPGLDGYEVLKRVRETYDMPVLMLTAVRGEYAIEHSLGLGADSYILKPFVPNVLVARIRAILRRARGEIRRSDEKTN